MDPKNKWNLKHKERLNHDGELTPNIRLKNMSDYLKGGSVLDIACGLGANSIFLAQLNYRVQALDISDVAITNLKQRSALMHLNINPFVCDLTKLESFHVQENSFDLVIMTYYLDRSIFSYVKSIVKKNGYFFMETYYSTSQNENQGISEKYKLQSNELLKEFGEWKVLYYEENEQEGRQTVFCQK